MLAAAARPRRPGRRDRAHRARDFGFRLTRTEAGPAAPARPLHLVGGGDPAPPHPGRADRKRPDRAALLGWYRLSFQTLGADRKEGGVQVAAPFARMEEILPILAEAGFPPPPPPAAFRGGPRRALVRWVAPWAGARFGRGGRRLAHRPARRDRRRSPSSCSASPPCCAGASTVTPRTPRALCQPRPAEAPALDDAL